MTKPSAPDEPDRPAAPPKSFGNMSASHWSRARAGTNEEALEYYRTRSKAPGVAGGGASRNFYCMRCDGVIPFDESGELTLDACPHCGESIAGTSKRYFNWVEINEPPKSDARIMLALAAGATLAVAAIVWVAWRLLS